MIKEISSTQTVLHNSVRKIEPLQKELKSEKVIEQQDKQQDRPTKEQLEKVVRSMNDFLQPSTTHLKFEFHEQLQEYFVSIVDNDTNEVVKEIPPKKLLDMYAAMTEYLGLLVDKKI